MPPHVTELLSQLGAPPRLVAHLTLVHDVACALTDRLDTIWPALRYDRAAVRLGAAVHDIGKTVHREELTHPGHAHEQAGETLLLSSGYSGNIARFARTHAQWDKDPAVQPEDLLVALADAWWRGKRDEQLEAAVAGWIAQETQDAQWQVFVQLDDIAAELTSMVDARLAWQNQFDA